MGTKIYISYIHIKTHTHTHTHTELGHTGSHGRAGGRVRQHNGSAAGTDAEVNSGSGKVTATLPPLLWGQNGIIRLYLTFLLHSNTLFFSLFLSSLFLFFSSFFLFFSLLLSFSLAIVIDFYYYYYYCYYHHIVFTSKSDNNTES